MREFALYRAAGREFCKQVPPLALSRFSAPDIVRLKIQTYAQPEYTLPCKKDKPGFEVVCIVPGRRPKRRERAEA